MKNLRWTDGILKRTLKRSTLTYQAGRQIMLKDKAQPIVVDEPSGRIDEADENRKESPRYSLMLLLSETSSAERNLGHTRARLFLKLCDVFKKTPLEKHGTT
jgi:hypothetical protein